MRCCRVRRSIVARNGVRDAPHKHIYIPGREQVSGSRLGAPNASENYRSPPRGTRRRSRVSVPPRCRSPALRRSGGSAPPRRIAPRQEYKVLTQNRVSLSDPIRNQEPQTVRVSTYNSQGEAILARSSRTRNRVACHLEHLPILRGSTSPRSVALEQRRWLRRPRPPFAPHDRYWANRPRHEIGLRATLPESITHIHFVPPYAIASRKLYTSDNQNKHVLFLNNLNLLSALLSGPPLQTSDRRASPCSWRNGGSFQGAFHLELNIKWIDICRFCCSER